MRSCCNKRKQKHSPGKEPKIRGGTGVLPVHHAQDARATLNLYHYQRPIICVNQRSTPKHTAMSRHLLQPQGFTNIRHLHISFGKNAAASILRHGLLQHWCVRSFYHKIGWSNKSRTLVLAGCMPYKTIGWPSARPATKSANHT
jgi:hypothetical protein